MQKIATKIFIGASVAFGVFGILMILTGPDSSPTKIHTIIQEFFQASVFVILPSFALSVAGKYLMNKDK